MNGYTFAFCISSCFGLAGFIFRYVAEGSHPFYVGCGVFDIVFGFCLIAITIARS